AGSPGPAADPGVSEVTAVPPPEHGDSRSPWAAFLRDHPLSFPERAAVILALVPHLRPRLLDVFFTKNATFDRRFTESGGWRLDDDFGPTGEPLAFVLGGDALEARLIVARLLEPDHPLIRNDVLRVGAISSHGASGRDLPPMKSPLRISPEYL